MTQGLIHDRVNQFSLLQNVQIGSGSPPPSLPFHCYQGVRLTPHLHLVLRLGMSGAVSVLPMHLYCTDFPIQAGAHPIVVLLQRVRVSVVGLMWQACLYINFLLCTTGRISILLAEIKDGRNVMSLRALK